jgi:uncharacterized protein
MFNKLLPKEEKYFDYFTDMIGLIAEMAELTNSLFSNAPYDRELLLKMKPLEKRCDEITSKVIKQLNKTFVTPFDREDIFLLIKKLDDISDILYAASIRLEMFRIQDRIDGADRLTAIVSLQMKELMAAMHDLRDKHKSMNECKAVKDLESEADTIYQAAMTRLFDEEKDPIQIMKKKEILDILENASDKCQSVANVIISIFIKNS